MQIERLGLRDWRLYEQLELELGAGATLLVGPNAAGKTSVLEAVLVLATTRSPRAAQDEELIRWAASATQVEAQAARERRGPVAVALEILRRAADGGTGVDKRLTVDGVVRGAREVVGQLAVVMFGPDDLGLVKGTPAQRRRFLNMALGQVSAGYLDDAARYRRALRQRNELLRQAARNPSQAPMLQSWDEQLIGYGSAVAEQRARYAQDLGRLAAEYHARLTDGRENLRVAYSSSVWREDTAPGAAAEVFREKLARARSQELELGRTLVGPHRDDLLLLLDGRSVRRFGSQGQQRTAALAAKLAEAHLTRERLGEAPVLLLDDAASELDSARAARVLELAHDGYQVLATATTRAGPLAAWEGRLTTYAVGEGRVQLLEAG